MHFRHDTTIKHALQHGLSMRVADNYVCINGRTHIYQTKQVRIFIIDFHSYWHVSVEFAAGKGGYSYMGFGHKWATQVATEAEAKMWAYGVLNEKVPYAN